MQGSGYRIQDAGCRNAERMENRVWNIEHRSWRLVDRKWRMMDAGRRIEEE